MPRERLSTATSYSGAHRIGGKIFERKLISQNGERFPTLSSVSNLRNAWK